MQYYKKVPTVVKTPALAEYLRGRGAGDHIYIVPVGLDTQLLKQDYSKYEISDLKQAWGYKAADKVILFVGRMTAEKQPLKMIELFKRIYEYDDQYRLLMVGQGELSEAAETAIKRSGLNSVVSIHKKVPNDKMWELYRLSECYVNLNTHEIFGMAILEAMYYESTVIALDAPGPSFIIENGVSGYVCDTDDMLFKRILEADRKKWHICQKACFGAFRVGEVSQEVTGNSRHIFVENMIFIGMPGFVYGGAIMIGRMLEIIDEQGMIGLIKTLYKRTLPVRNKIRWRFCSNKKGWLGITKEKEA